MIWMMFFKLIYFIYKSYLPLAKKKTENKKCKNKCLALVLEIKTWHPNVLNEDWSEKLEVLLRTKDHNNATSTSIKESSISNTQGKPKILSILDSEFPKFKLQYTLCMRNFFWWSKLSDCLGLESTITSLNTLLKLNYLDLSHTNKKSFSCSHTQSSLS